MFRLLWQDTSDMTSVAPPTEGHGPEGSKLIFAFLTLWSDQHNALLGNIGSYMASCLCPYVLGCVPGPLDRYHCSPSKLKTKNSFCQCYGQ